MDKTEDKRKEVTRIELKYEMTEEKGGNDQVVLFNPYFSMIHYMTLVFVHMLIVLLFIPFLIPFLALLFALSLTLHLTLFLALLFALSLTLHLTLFLTLFLTSFLLYRPSLCVAILHLFSFTTSISTYT